MNESLRQKYNRLQDIREWNARFTVPPVCTAQWTTADHARWDAGRQPLPPFDEWIKTQPQDLTTA